MATLNCFWGRQLLLGASLLAGPAGAAAQTLPDTTRLHYGEEVAVPPLGDTPLRVQQEQRNLWKLGLNNFLPYRDSFGEGTRYTRYGLHFGLRA